MKSGKNKNLDMGKAYKLIAGYTRKRNVPLKAYLEISRRCNFKCAHCLFQHTRSQKKDMTYREICSVISQFADMGIFYLLITGGEPFLRPDFWDILRFAKRLGFAIDINTNASLITKDVARRLEDIGICAVTVSIYGLSEYSCRKVTRTFGSFAKLWKGVNLLIKLWQKGQIPGGLKLKFVLFRDNFFELDKFEKFRKKLTCFSSIEWQFHPCTDKSRVPLRYSLTPSQTENLARKFPNLFAPYFDHIPLESGFLCQKGGGRRTVNVNSFGEVIPCPVIEKGGNIREKPIKEIINKHPLFIKFRSVTWKDIPKCNVCEALRFCRPCPFDFFVYTNGKLSSDFIPKLMCKDKMGWERKRLYEKYIALKR